MKNRQSIKLFCLLLCGAFLFCGCQDSEPKASTKAAKNSKTKPAAENPTTVAKVDTQATSTPQPTPSVSQNADDENPPSPLDQAAKTLKQQPIEEPQKPAPAVPQEVHEQLASLVAENWIRLNPAYEVWFDKENRQVIVGGRVSLREGLLEMFACPRDTKEHESVISTVSDAKTVHAGLLATGAIPGIPGYWTEETGVVTAQGCTCKVTVVWQDAEQENPRQEVNAKQMVMDLRTKETLQHDWVFAGSRWWQDPKDPSYREYQADAGDMICVSNFPSAMLDLNVESSSSNSSLAFGANPETVPPLGQPVLVFIKPDISTNPTPETIAAAIKKRDDYEAKMKAALEARIKEMEKRDAEWEAKEAQKRKDAAADQDPKDNSDDAKDG